ncbi:MAG: hypothetical protein KF901_33155 [Myxococcales bacterium]|nr:hypothetical protein [Myxococcales bacterium]
MSVQESNLFASAMIDHAEIRDNAHSSRFDCAEIAYNLMENVAVSPHKLVAYVKETRLTGADSAAIL